MLNGHELVKVSLEPPDIARIQSDYARWRRPLFEAHRLASFDILEVTLLVLS
jgi:hypothetical protein